MFNNIELMVWCGEKFVVVGVLGFGKSMLLYVLGGFDELSVGEVLLFGKLFM